MTHKELQQIVLDKLKREGACPTPRWHFLLKNYFVWCFALISLFVGSLGFAVVLYMTINNDWGIYENIHDSFIGFVFATIPYFWILIVILFLVTTDYNLRHTNKGYKVQLHYAVLGSVLGSVILGTLFYNVGLGRAIDETFVKSVPYYEKVMRDRHKRWTSLDQGRVGGLIIFTEDDDSITIQDKEGNEWIIEIDNDTNVFGKMEVGNFVKIIGEFHDEKFEAGKIFEGKKGPGLAPFPGGHPNIHPKMLNKGMNQFRDNKKWMKEI
jgi:hypothetical protein